MSRTIGKRTWVKLFCYERLHGSVSYQLEPEERSVWDELLCLAGLCGLDGLIADRDSRPYPHSFIAHELHISEELLERTLTKCKDEGRITENEKGIHLTNWVAYQSEYQRQKPYRKKISEDTTKYKQGRYGHRVASTRAEVEAQRKERDAARHQEETGIE